MLKSNKNIGGGKEIQQVEVDEIIRKEIKEINIKCHANFLG